MLISTIVQLITGHEEAKNLFEQIVYFIGTFGTAMLISVIFAIFSMGLNRGRKMDDIMKSVTNAIYQIGMMILIIGGGGTFKQVLMMVAWVIQSQKCSKVLQCHLSYLLG